MNFGACSDVGLVRPNNEDAFLTLPEASLFAVADGVGGESGGEVASRMAVTILESEYTKVPTSEPPDPANLIKAAFEKANRAIFVKNLAQRTMMATTLTAVRVRGQDLMLVHAGDSKALVIDHDRVEQISTDHTVVEDWKRQGVLTAGQAAAHPRRHVITKALGTEEPLNPEVASRRCPPGSILLLCSDGLTDCVSFEEIARIARTTDDLQDMARRLVGAANRNGGPDNVTVVTLRMGAKPGRPRTRVGRRAAGMLLLLTVMGASAAAANWYLNQLRYLGVENGRVAIFRGAPAAVAGLSLSRLEQATLIPIGALRPPYDRRVTQGLTVRDPNEVRSQLLSLMNAEPPPSLAYVKGDRLLLVRLQQDGLPVEPPQSWPVGFGVTRLGWSDNGILIVLISGGEVKVVVPPEERVTTVARGDSLVSAGHDMTIAYRSGSDLRSFDLFSGNDQPLASAVSTPSSRLSPQCGQASGETILDSPGDTRYVLSVRKRSPARPVDRPRGEIWLTERSGRKSRRVTAGECGLFGASAESLIVLRHSRETAGTYDLIVTDLDGKDRGIIDRGVSSVFAVYRPLVDD